MTEKKASFKELFGWCMFDFANSSYTTVIITVVFGDIFAKLIIPQSANIENPYDFGNFLWGMALAVSYLIVVVTGPILGAITDYSAQKKLFLFLSYIFCILSTAALWFIDKPGMIVLPFVLIVVSNFFFSSGENFASSFLPFLGSKEELGKISGYAWGIGYFGGLLSVGLVGSLGDITLDNFQNLRLVGPYTAIFFLFAGIPTFLFLKEHGVSKPNQKNVSYIQLGFQEVYHTIRTIHIFKDLAIFLISLFFAMAALAVVISFTFIYGTQVVQITMEHKTWMFILLQFSAAFGAVSFGLIQDKIGAKKTYSISLVIWIICIFLIYQVHAIATIANSIGISISVQWVFVVLTVFAGIGVGATQSASRAIVGILAPESKSGEFFGLWGLSGKIAAAFGLAFISWLQYGLDMRKSFIAIGVFFVISLAINQFVDENRGITTAKNFKD